MRAGKKEIQGDLTVAEDTILLGNLTQADVNRNEDNIMLNAFRVAVNGSLTQFSMVDGIVDEYEDESGIDTGNSTNEDYDATGDYYTPYKTISGVDEYTKLMLHFNGADAATSTTDSSDSNHTVSFGGDAQLDTAQKQWGSASVLFDGTGDYLSIPDSADWNLGAGEFTIDFWIRPGSVSGDTVLFSQGVLDTGTGFASLQLIISSGTLKLSASTNGSSWDVFNAVSCGSVSADTGYHIAIVRNGDALDVYKDGVSQYNTDASSITFADGAGDLILGAIHYDATFQGLETYVLFFQGWIDEFRWSKGVARWTGDFTPPDAEYLDSAETFSMTLISDTFIADVAPDNARIVLLEEDVDAVTINTDLKAYISRDGGTTYTEVTLVDEGNYDSSKQILGDSIDISGQPSGTSIKYKITTLNSKDLKLHGVGLSWD